MVDIFLFKKRFLRNNSSYLLLFCIPIGVFLAWLIVWQPLYFLILSVSFALLAIIFWKTESSLVALIFYLPFQLALNVTSDIDLASSRVFIVVLFLAWFIKSLAKKRLMVPYKSATWLIIILLGLAFLSAYFSINVEKSVIRLLFFFSIIPLYFVAADYLNSFQKISKAIYVLLASAAVAALIGVVQFFGQFIFGIDAVMNLLSQYIAAIFYGQSFSKVVLANPSWLVNIGGATYLRAISLFPDPHQLAFYLGLVIPIALSLLLFSGRLNFSFEKKLLLGLVNAILFLAMLLTFSRAGYFGAVFGIGTILVFGWKILEEKIKFLIIFSTLGIIFYLGIFSSAGGLVVNRFFAIFNLSEGSNSERVANWRQAVNIVENYPLAGVGVGSYSLAIDPRAESRTAISAHNSYLDIAAEMGIAAALAWILLLFCSIIKLLTVFRSKDPDIGFNAKIISLGLAGSLVWFSVQMVFDTAIYSPALLALSMIYLAISVNLEKKSCK